MDEFSWFIGLFEGEGCVYADCRNVVISIAMADEDVIQRAAKFLNCSYHSVKPKKEGYKTQYRTKKNGGATRGYVYDLLKRMKPHLSSRRQKQIDTVIYKVHSKQVKFRKIHSKQVEFNYD